MTPSIFWNQAALGKTVPGDGADELSVLGEKYCRWKETIVSSGSDRDINDDLLNHLPVNPFSALDAGCGPGFTSLLLAERIQHVVALDISKEMIRYARKKSVEQRKANIHFVMGDLLGIPFQEKTFDLVVSLFAIHLTPLEVTLNVLRQLVKPRGIILISDIITRNPGLDAIPLWRILCTLRGAPSLARTLGFRTMLKLISFQITPAWVRHVCHLVRTGVTMTPERFEEVYTRLLPGCTIKRCDWRMLVMWEAPE